MDTAAELCITVVIGDVGARLAGGRDSLFRACAACAVQSIGTGMLCGLRAEHSGWGHPIPIPLSPINFMEARSAPIPPSFGKDRIHTYTPTPMKNTDVPRKRFPLSERPRVWNTRGVLEKRGFRLFFRPPSRFFYFFLFSLLPPRQRLTHPRRSAPPPSRQCGSPPAARRPPTSRRCQPSRIPTHRSCSCARRACPREGRSARCHRPRTTTP